MPRRSVRQKRVRVQKYFDAGWFEGFVTSSRVDEDGETLHFILYEDCDREEVDEFELKILVENYEADMKSKAVDGRTDNVVVIDSDDESDDDSVEIIEPPPQKKTKQEKQTLVPTTIKKMTKQPKGLSIDHNSRNSSLWRTLTPFDGKPVTRESIKALVDRNPPEGLPKEMRYRIPELVEFFVLMLERQLIQQGKKTDLEVLQKFHWCNNYRELDRGTAYFRSQVLKLVDDESQLKSAPTNNHDTTMTTRLQYMEQVLGMAYYYRQCNLIESFIHPDNPAGGIPRLGKFDEAFVHYVKSYQRERRTFFTSAHLNQGLNRYIGYCRSSEALLRKTAKDIASIGEFDMDRVCQLLRNLPGVGAFTSWQIACDLEEACCFGPKVRTNAESGVLVEKLVELEDSFCELGPGAKRGLQKIFGEQIYHEVKKKDRKLVGLTLYVRDNMDYCLSLVGEEFPLWKNRRVTLKVIEHALCEYQKFVEIESGSIQGQRRWRSRAKMDKRIMCCGQRMIRCDTCHYIGCEGCQQDKFQSIKPAVGFGWNCCHRCHALDHLDLVD